MSSLQNDKYGLQLNITECQILFQNQTPSLKTGLFKIGILIWPDSCVLKKRSI